VTLTILNGHVIYRRHTTLAFKQGYLLLILKAGTIFHRSSRKTPGRKKDFIYCGAGDGT
jgi:hypothetical protein